MRFHPSYHLAGASPLLLDIEYLFLVGSNNLLSTVVQQQVVILEFSQEKMSTHPSTPPSWRKSWLEIQQSENKDHGIQSHYFMGNRWETMETVRNFIGEAPKSLQVVTGAMKLKDACSLEEML